MTSPYLRFVNSNGEEFKENEDGIQRVKQYAERWRVKVYGNIQGSVYLEGTPREPLYPVRNRVNEWQLPKLSFDERKRVSGAGTIIAVLCNQAGKEIRDKSGNKIIASLLVFPANINEEELDKMIKEIGQLALATSCLHREIKDESWYPGNGLLATANSLLELYEVTKRQWSSLEKRYLKSFVKKAAPVNASRTRSSPRSLMRAKLEPHRRRVLDITQVESSDCLENEFLSYVLDTYLKDLAKSLEHSLKYLIVEDIDSSLIEQSEFDKRQDKSFKEFKEEIRKNSIHHNNSRERYRKKVERFIRQLQECYAWANQARQSSFLAVIKTPLEFKTSSARLRGTSTYAAILAKLQACQEKELKPVSKVLYLIRSIYRGQIRTTWEIYEIWCFIKLYSTFVLYNNMYPQEESFLFDNLKLTSEGVEIPRDTKFVLENKFDGKHEVQLTFWYDTFFRGKRPDIRLEIDIDGQRRRYCFDAKYRNYQQQGNQILADDVLGVARDKYIRDLSSKDSPITASFILHTSSVEYDYWGEVPFSKFLDEHQDKTSSLTSIYRYSLSSDIENISKGAAYAGHQYGAISLKPSNNPDKTLRKLTRLLLQYHGSLKTTCLNCGHELNFGNEIQTSLGDVFRYQVEEENFSRQVLEGKAHKGIVFYYSCNKCGDFWVNSHCLGEHHRLLKFKDSFHKKTDPDSNKWSYDCPVCGSQLGT